jgi:hypothetical protein
VCPRFALFWRWPAPLSLSGRRFTRVARSAIFWRGGGFSFGLLRVAWLPNLPSAADGTSERGRLNPPVPVPCPRHSLFFSIRFPALHHPSKRKDDACRGPRLKRVTAPFGSAQGRLSSRNGRLHPKEGDSSPRPVTPGLGDLQANRVNRIFVAFLPGKGDNSEPRDECVTSQLKILPLRGAA